MAVPKTNKRPKIIAVFIAYNVAHALPEFYRNFPKHLVDDMILVDNQSEDNTYGLAKKLGITAYQNSTNIGYGGNLKRAISLALERGADIIVDLHPDNEYLPSAILPAIQKVKEGAAMVLGRRFNRMSDLTKHGMYAWKLPPLMLMSAIHRLVLGTRIKDLHQGFRVYTRKLLERVPFERGSNNYIFSFEIIAQTIFKKLPIAEVPVETRYEGKKRGASLKSSIRYSLGTFKILWLFLLARLGLPVKLFQRPTARLADRIQPLAHPERNLK